MVGYVSDGSWQETKGDALEVLRTLFSSFLILISVIIDGCYCSSGTLTIPYAVQEYAAETQ